MKLGWIAAAVAAASAFAPVAEGAAWPASCVTSIASGQTTSGQLASTDCSWNFVGVPGEHYYTDVYTFSGTAGQQVRFALTSSAFDAYLELYTVNDIAATPIASDDDSAGGLNARIPSDGGWYALPATGTYYLWVQPAVANQTGTYSLAFTVPTPSVPTLPTLPTTNGDKVTVTEFYHPQFDHYFITAYPEEAASLAAGNLKPWTPTGQTFKVWSAAGSGITNVCRFFSTSFAPRSSHFYSGNPAECPGLQNGHVWTLESSNAFYMMTTSTGACGAGTKPLYRLYNNGQGGAPNHRYTVSPALRATMIGQGWVPEGNGADGVFACVPGYALPVPTGSATQKEVMGYVNTLLGLVSGDVLNLDQLGAILTAGLTSLGSGGTCPAATANPPLANLTEIPANLTLAFDFGNGCLVPSGSDKIDVAGRLGVTISNLALTDSAVSATFAATFGNVRANGVLVADGRITGNATIGVNGSTGAYSGPIALTLENFTLPNDTGFSGTATINLNSAGSTVVTTNLTSSHGVAIRLNLSSTAQSDGSQLVADTGPGTVGAYTVRLNNLRLDSEVCPTMPYAGTATFSRNGQTSTLTFARTCTYTYTGP